MLNPLKNPTFRQPFAAPIGALPGTGLATVAPGLLSSQLAGEAAVAVLAIKLVAGVTLAPIAAAAAVLLAVVRFPVPFAGSPFRAGVTKGTRIDIATPRRRGLMVMQAAAVAAGAMVGVNTVVLLQARPGLGAEPAALAVAGLGAGSMLAAVLLTRNCDLRPDHPHLVAHAASHCHAFVIDDLHRRRPQAA